MYTPEAPACAAGPSLRHGPRPSPLSSWAGSILVYVCVSFFFFLYKICTQSTPGLGRDGPGQIRYRKKK